MTIECQDSYEAPSPADVRDLEDHLGCELPHPYKAFLMEHNGGAFRPEAVYSLGSSIPFLGEKVAIQRLLAINGEKSSDVRWSADWLRSRIPHDFIPIADTGWGDPFCIGIQGEHYGELYLWDHEHPFGPEAREKLHFIAPSFDTFVDGLVPDVEELEARAKYESDILRAIAMWDTEGFQRLMASLGDVDTAFDEGKTPLMAAARSWNLAAAKLLLEAGADPEKTDDNGHPAMFFAISAHSVDGVKLLLRDGANVNARDSRGWSLLMEAIACLSVRIANLLISAGADVNVKSANGETALTCCDWNAQTLRSLRQTLVAAGAVE